MGYKVAVIGATGNVGREMLNILAEREFPADEVFAKIIRTSGRPVVLVVNKSEGRAAESGFYFRSVGTFQQFHSLTIHLNLRCLTRRCRRDRLRRRPELVRWASQMRLVADPVRNRSRHFVFLVFVAALLDA